MNNLSKKDVAIVVPLSTREFLVESERISLNHLHKYLGEYEKFFVTSKRMNLSKIETRGFKIKRFPNRFFGSANAHNRLLTSKSFYSKFTNYKYILIYHLDALVFSDRLLEWCEKDYDFIGPPWISTEFQWLSESGVGNGGFSLRKVKTFIQLYSLGNYWENPTDLSNKISNKSPILKSTLKFILNNIFKLKILNNIKIHLLYYLYFKELGEDRFIWKYAKNYVPNFKIPSVEEALKFGFEVSPRKCYELNNNLMPFGCHAFEKYDLEFWEPFLIKSLK